jgi:acyl carrier protein
MKRVESKDMSDGMQERVREVLERILGVPRESAVDSARLDELAPLDSLSLAELASALDQEFSIEVPGENLTTSLSVAELTALVDEARSAAASIP